MVLHKSVGVRCLLVLKKQVCLGSMGASEMSCAVQAAVYSDIESLFGREARDYVANKQRGGVSGQKGTRYEDYFVAFKVAEIAAEHISTSNAPWPTIGSQMVGFVDDVVVEDATSTTYFQLKNVQSLSWKRGSHPLEIDFKCQFALASEKWGKPSPYTELVVSSETLHATLTAAIPAPIAAHSRVSFFPYCEGGINQYVLTHPGLQECLKALAKSENAHLDELEAVLGVLILASSYVSPEGGRVDDIIRKTRRNFPHQLRSLVADTEQLLEPEFRAALDAIPGLSYSVERGFFRWEGFGTVGTFRVDCEHEDFARFQTEIIAKQPQTFDDFEGQL